MADYGAGAHLPGAAGRSRSHGRFGGAADGPSAAPTVHGKSRAQDYDRALQQSIATATARRRTAATARSYSQSLRPHDDAESADQTPVQSVSVSAVRDEDRAPDGGVGSELGDSYVDEIALRKGGKLFLHGDSERREDDELRDAGVLGLLAQIYDQGRTAL
jgi:autophagy-related protein 9